MYVPILGNCLYVGDIGNVVGEVSYLRRMGFSSLVTYANILCGALTAYGGLVKAVRG